MLGSVNLKKKKKQNITRQNLQNVKRRYFTVQTCISNVKVTVIKFIFFSNVTFEHHIPLI